MTEDEARATLLQQVLPDDAVGKEEPTSLLGGLRPFRGVLPTQSFHQTMAALRVLAPSFTADRQVDRELVSALWSLCHLLPSWALHEDSMLRSNNLLSADQVSTLSEWHNLISYAVMILLEANDPSEAFHEYEAYLAENAGEDH